MQVSRAGARHADDEQRALDALAEDLRTFGETVLDLEALRQRSNDVTAHAAAAERAQIRALERGEQHAQRLLELGAAEIAQTGRALRPSRQLVRVEPTAGKSDSIERAMDAVVSAYHRGQRFFAERRSLHARRSPLLGTDM